MEKKASRMDSNNFMYATWWKATSWIEESTLEKNPDLQMTARHSSLNKLNQRWFWDIQVEMWNRQLDITDLKLMKSQDLGVHIWELLAYGDD